LRNSIATFWERVTDGLELHQLWGQFKSEAKASYRLYSADVDWHDIDGKSRGNVGRYFRAAWALFQAMLMKLSPARRVLLLVAILLLLFQPSVRFNRTQHAEMHLEGLGVVILFVLLAIELADRVTMKRDLEIAREIQYCRAHSLDGRRFTTAFLAELDVDTREMVYVNAGHNPPILRRASGRIERLESGGPPFGIPILRDAGLRYQPGRLQLHHGDLLLVFTDGLTEAVNDADQDYGEDRLLATIQNRPAETAAETLTRVMNDVNGFVGQARQYDDITALVLRVQNSTK
jgi:hypothetical protein